jgi:hypothetical protein
LPLTPLEEILCNIFNSDFFIYQSNLAKLEENQVSKNDMNGYSIGVSSGLYSLNFIIVYTHVKVITCFQLYLGFFSFFSQIRLKSQLAILPSSHSNFN